MAMLSRDKYMLLNTYGKELLQKLGSVVLRQTFWSDLMAKRVITGEDKEQFTVSFLSSFTISSLRKI